MDISQVNNLRHAYQELERHVQRALNTQVGDNVVRNMVFFELFLSYFKDLLLVLLPPHSFLSVSLFQEKTRRVLLISRRGRAQRTTTTDDPFQALSKRPSLWVVLQVHLPFVVSCDLPQQDISFLTR